MYQRIAAHCSTLSPLQVVMFGLLFAVGVEALTVGSRFGLGLEATRDTGLLSYLTYGIRIHHGYVGLLLIGFSQALA